LDKSLTQKRKNRMGKEKIANSFADILNVIPTDKLEKPKEEKTTKPEKVSKKEKQLYESTNIRIKGTQLATTDGNYETYSEGSYTSWRVTMIGQKNGAVDILTDIKDGYPHGSFHNRERAATILVEMINRYKQ